MSHSREAAYTSLSIHFENEQPFSSRSLANLLGALSRDYRTAFKGRDLAVVKIETGSLTIVLADAAAIAAEWAPFAKDAVEIAKGGKAILDFAKAIKDLFKKKEIVTKIEPRSDEIDVSRSLDAIADAATSSKSEICVTQTKPDGTKISIKATPPKSKR